MGCFPRNFDDVERPKCHRGETVCEVFFGTAVLAAAVVFLVAWRSSVEGTLGPEFVEGSERTLCQIESAGGRCRVAAPGCAGQGFSCGGGFFNGTAVDVEANETTCYVEPECRGVHFAEPEPAAEDFVAWAIGCMLLGLAVWVFVPVCLLGFGLVPLPLLSLVIPEALLVTGTMAGIIYFIVHGSGWESAISEQNAWARNGTLELCTVVTHPIDVTGSRQSGHGFVDVVSPQCPQPMRWFQSASEVRTADAQGITQSVALRPGAAFDCYTLYDCSAVKAKYVSGFEREICLFVFAFLLSFRGLVNMFVMCGPEQADSLPDDAEPPNDLEAPLLAQDDAPQRPAAEPVEGGASLSSVGTAGAGAQVESAPPPPQPVGSLLGSAELCGVSSGGGEASSDPPAWEGTAPRQQTMGRHVGQYGHQPPPPSSYRRPSAQVGAA